MQATKNIWKYVNKVRYYVSVGYGEQSKGHAQNSSAWSLPSDLVPCKHSKVFIYLVTT